MKNFYRIATRASKLALRQAEMAAAYLAVRIDGFSFEIVEIKTTGDKKQAWSLEKQGGKGLFTKEIEDALLDGSADIAVHSAKDLPTEETSGLSLAGAMPRDDSRDVLVVREGVSVPSLIATSSPRRRAQLKLIFPQAVWSEIRGNVDTRLQKIADGAADATVLSAAGLERLGISGWEGLVFKPLKVQTSVPAVGQGMIALQCRDELLPLLSPLMDEKATYALKLEREFLSALGGGCQVAYGAHYDGEYLHCFHENCGYQKIRFNGVEKGQMSSMIAEIARGLTEK